MLLMLLTVTSSALGQWERFHGNSMNTGVVPGSQGLSGTLSELWTFEILGFSNSSPALGDLDGDGRLEVVFGSWNEALFAVNGEDGSILWSYPILGLGNSGAPIIADIDNDQKPEVVFSSGDTLYAFQGESGDLLWSSVLSLSSTGTSPSAADLDGDGTLEVIFGESSQIRAYDGETGSVIWVATGYEIRDYGSSVAEDVDGDGAAEVMVMKQDSPDNHFSLLSGLDGSEIWSSPIDCNWPYSPVPAYADIDLDGNPEIVSCFGDNDVYVYNPLNGEVIWHAEHPGEACFASPVLADIDGNGTLEIFTTSYYLKEMYAYSCTGDLIWTASIEHWPLGTAAIVDIDGDSELEIIQPSANTVTPNGCLQIFDAKTGVEEYWQYYAGMLGASPAVGDLDGDGFYDIVFGSNNEKVYALTIAGQGIESGDNQYDFNLSAERNPFVATAAISVEISSPSFTEVKIMDLCGRQVASLCEETLDSGMHTFYWDPNSHGGSSVASGLYLCVVICGDQVGSIELCYLK